MTWPLTLSVDDSAKDPLFRQIYSQVVSAIRAGRLRRGERLPGTRSLARQIGVNRNTAVAAYAELEAEGWIEVVPAQGARVCEALPQHVARAWRSTSARDLRPGYALGPARKPRPLTTPQDVLWLSGGMPDPTLLPGELIARAYRRAVTATGGSLFDYGDSQGHPALREQIAAMLRTTRSVTVDADQVLITRGSQMGLYLISRALLSAGDRVGIESFGYWPAWQAISQSGAKLLPIALDQDGLCVERLIAASDREPVRAVYLTPHHQYPTTVTLSAARRIALMDWAARRKVMIIEDDFDHEFHYDGRPVLPLASADPKANVIYVGTLSKVLAPGLRLGFVAAPREVIARLLFLRQAIDNQGDLVSERAVAELLEDDEVQRHVRRVRRVYRDRRQRLTEALETHLGEHISYDVPAGGMAFWVQAKSVDLDAWCRRAHARGVGFAPARYFAYDGRARPYFRLGFAGIDADAMLRGIKVLAKTLRA